MRFVILSLLTFFIASMLTSCSLFCTEINLEDIPMYPNAQNIKQDEPMIDGIEIYTWCFTTTDSPEKVWEFYKEKMVNDWKGSDHSLPQSTEKDVMIKGCLYYYFKMNSAPIDATTYNITIQFSREPYR
jgi:hypothetical protein